jgi:hypothetical protein
MSQLKECMPNMHTHIRVIDIHTYTEIKTGTHLIHVFASNHIQIRILHLLASSVSPEDIGQENLCCINTSIAMFLFAERRGELVSFLQSIATSRDTLLRLQRLFQFWILYYVGRLTVCC